MSRRPLEREGVNLVPVDEIQVNATATQIRFETKQGAMEDAVVRVPVRATAGSSGPRPRPSVNNCGP